MNTSFKPATLLLSLLDRGCGKILVDASRQAGARGGTKLFGRGTQWYSGIALTEYHPQDIVITLMWDEAESIIAAVAEHASKSFDRVCGAALVIDVPRALTREHSPLNQPEIQPSGDGDSDMKPGFTMIAAITNQGEAETLMDAARKAGATGGTIVDARGTGTEADFKYFGISLVPEKELLLIISEDTRTDAILDALSSQPILSQPGGGIIFTTKVARLLPLGDER